MTDIDADAHVVNAKDKTWHYDKLVLATGASAFVPPVEGRELMVTLNSQLEYQASETLLRDATRVMIVGGGLIGTELAMDFCRAGKSVTLVDHAASILSALMPAEVSSRLQHRLTDMGVHLLLKSQLQSLSKPKPAFVRRSTATAAWKWMWLLRRRGCARKPRWRTARAQRSIAA